MSLEATLLGIVIALLTWTVKTVHDLDVKLASVVSDAAASKERGADHEEDILELRTRVTQLEIQVAKFIKNN